MAPTSKEKTKTDLDHALRRCIDEREDWQLALETQSAILGIASIKSGLGRLSDKWEHVVSANFLFVDSREYGTPRSSRPSPSGTRLRGAISSTSELGWRTWRIWRDSSRHLIQVSGIRWPWPVWQGTVTPLPPPPTQQRNRDQ